MLQNGIDQGFDVLIADIALKINKEAIFKGPAGQGPGFQLQQVRTVDIKEGQQLIQGANLML